MKNLFLFTSLFFMFLGIKSNAQKVPVSGFKVTDIFGFQHNLYNDYLNEGKYVFIDFFTVNCGSCQEHAPKIDSVYREYACNCGNLKFIGIDIASYTGNQEVWGFVNDYNMTFPAVSGTDGGGYYIDDLYNIPYTPWMLLISPEGEIIFENPPIQTAQELRDTLENLNLGFEVQQCSGTDFLYYGILFENDTIRAELDYNSHTANIILPYKTDLSTLTALFVASTNSVVMVENIVQETNLSENDFSQGTVIYEIEAENSDNMEWAVNVQIANNISQVQGDNLIIYPNPNNGLFSIKNFNQNDDYTKIEITNILGKIIFQQNINQVAKSNNIEINLKNIEEGIYFIKFFTKNKNFTKKIYLKNIK